MTGEDCTVTGGSGKGYIPQPKSVKKSKTKIRIDFHNQEYVSSSGYVAQNDAIQAPKRADYIPIVQRNVNKQDLSDVLKKYFHVQTWDELYADYIPRNKSKYNSIKMQILNDENLTDKSLAPKIANMICKLSDDYGLDPEICRIILAHESTFRFTPDVMEHPGSIYKGVMQVNLENLQIMFANQKDADNKTLPIKKRRIAYDNRLFNNDAERIEELKKTYKTPEKLYEAMQHDVALGVEIGLMVFKSKLTYFHGDVAAAFKSYGACYNSKMINKYNLPKQINPQKYKRSD